MSRSRAWTHKLARSSAYGFAGLVLVLFSGLQLTSLAFAQAPRMSCYGRCGARPRAGCACDPRCESRGDCCVDKHALCFAQTTTALGPLVDGNTAPRAVWGTDLGISYSYFDGARMQHEMLFGDTWSPLPESLGLAWPLPSICGREPAREDAIATLPATRPRSLPTTRRPRGPVPVPQPRFVLDRAGQRFAPLEVHRRGRMMESGYGRTPLAGFSVTGRDGVSRPHALFVLGEPVSCGTECARAGGLCVLDHCVDETSSQRSLGSNRMLYIELAFRPEPEDATRYESRASFATNKFVNPVVAAITHLHDDAQENDYTPGEETLLVWGRPYWHAPDLGSRARLYLFSQSLEHTDDDGALRFAPRYFAGLDRRSRPRWSEAQRDAICLYGGPGSGCLDQTQEEIATPNQTEIVWLAGIRKWLMIYGGDLSDFIDDLWRAIPRAWGQARTPNDEPAHGAIHARLADHPWGPWSAPVPLLFREQVAEFLACHPPGSSEASYQRDATPTWAPPSSLWPYDLRCVQGEAAGPDALWNCLLDPRRVQASIGRGNLYAPNVIEAWTAERDELRDAGPYARAAQLYWNVSLWNPYHVLLLSTRIELPAEHAEYDRAVRLRASSTQRVLDARRRSPSARSRDLRPRSTELYLRRVSAEREVRAIRDGDVVAIQTRAGAFLARDGRALRLARGLTQDTYFRVRAAGVDAGSPLSLGLSFTLEAVGTRRRGLRLHATEDGSLAFSTSARRSARWELSWECRRGDRC